VDTSGQWGRGGIFRSIHQVTPHVAAYYEQAKLFADLKMGDVHVVGMGDTSAD